MSLFVSQKLAIQNYRIAAKPPNFLSHYCPQSSQRQQLIAHLPALFTAGPPQNCEKPTVLFLQRFFNSFYWQINVSPNIQDFYTNEAAKEYFERFEGKQLELPYKFIPNKAFLSKHREKLIG